MSHTSREVLRRLPKTDLHCHLDGSVRPATLLELAKRFKVKLPADTVEDLFPFVRVSPSCGSLAEFLAVFEAIYPLLRHPEAVERIAYELVEDCALDGIRHVEARFSPELQATKSFPHEAVIEAALRGLARGQKEFGTTSSVIVCLIRGHSRAQNERSFKALESLFHPRAGSGRPAVVGLDVAGGDEGRHPMSDFADWYERAKRLGVWTTAHAGEIAGAANIRQALELGVLRIGHGVRLADDPALVREAARRRVPVEVNLTSNVFTKSVPSLEAHPARKLREAGVPITLNTDDRAMMGIDLTHEYEQALKLGFSFDALCDIAAESVDHAFLAPRERAALKARVTREIAELRSEVPA